MPLPFTDVVAVGTRVCLAVTACAKYDESQRQSLGSLPHLQISKIRTIATPKKITIKQLISFFLLFNFYYFFFFACCIHAQHRGRIVSTRIHTRIRRDEYTIIPKRGEKLPPPWPTAPHTHTGINFLALFFPNLIFHQLPKLDCACVRERYYFY